ncbi:MAG TPA: cytochrome P450 [Pseudonocardiaceae bacterium]|jgi:cytochrome P450|nr:cytochrome P450 [Pseudonocardiaceae bacterium]
MAKSVDEILSRVDLFDDDQREQLVPALAKARTECPVLHTDSDGGYHVVTRYDDVRTVCLHPEVFSSKQPGLRGVPVRLIPIDTDPPDHRAYRWFLNDYFSRSYLLRYEQDMRTIARTAIDGFADAGEFDVVGEYSIPFSAGSLAKIVFATDDQDLVERGVAAVKRVALEATPDTFEAVAALAMEAMAAVSGGDHLLAALVTATVDGRPLTVEERLGIVTTLLLGGLDTTRGMIANIAYHLATRPDVEQRLRDPDWWQNGTLDEFLRFEPTVSFMARTVTVDNDLLGVPLHAGDRLAIHFYSANRDATHFAHADELTFGRDTNPHLAFGAGVHKCLGLHFARIQLAVAFDELLARATNFRLVRPQDIRRQMGVPLNSPYALRLAFDSR